MLVSAPIRRAKLICSVLEQYLYDVLLEKNIIVIDVLPCNNLSNFIYKIENKLTLLRAKISYKFKNIFRNDHK